MNILVQGTKDGYKVLYPKPTPTEFFQFAADIRRTDSKSDKNFFGKELYSIAFASNGCIFTKYVIVYDTQRGSIGDVGLSVFIPNNQKIAGAEVKALLDRLADTYCQNYCPDFNLDNKQEDWLLFTSLANKYDNRLKPVDADDIENLQSGSQDAAFVYYSDAAELQKYFDAPYQNEYAPYRQILFVEKALKDKPENPLNALRHSGNDLTGKIDLDNPDYKLREFHGQGKNGINIEIKNSKNRPLHNKDKIYRKEIVTVTYYKQYYEPITETGKLTDLQISKYLIVDEANRKIEVNKNVELTPKEKTVFFNITDSKGHKVNDAEMQIATQPWQPIQNNQILFKGEQIGQKWSISARKGDYISNPTSFVPDQQNESLRLILIKQKIIQFTVTNENGQEIQDFELNVIDKGTGYHRGYTITFTDDEIEQPHTIYIRHKDYKEYEIKEYNPSSGKSPLVVKLQKKSGQKSKCYFVDPGEHGTKRCADYSEHHDGHDLPEKPVVPKKGFEFISWKFDESYNKDGYNGRIIAQYRKKEPFYKQPKFIVGSIVSVIVIVWGIWGIIALTTSEHINDDSKITIETIVEYTKGDELRTAILNGYKAQLPKPESAKNKNSKWNPLNWFKSNDKNIDSISTEQANYDNAIELIDNALQIRNLIKEKNYGLLQQKSSGKFKEALVSVDSIQFVELIERLNDIDNLALSLITDSINAIGKVEPESKQTQTKTDKKEQQKAESNPTQQNVQNATTKAKSSDGYESYSETSNNRDDIIKQELQSATITKQRLQEISEENISKLKNSIALYKEFFDLVGKSNKKEEFDTLLKKIKKDNILKDSELKNFLNNICASSDAFKPFNALAGKTNIKTLSELNSKLK